VFGETKISGCHERSRDAKRRHGHSGVNYAYVERRERGVGWASDNEVRTSVIIADETTAIGWRRSGENFLPCIT